MESKELTGEPASVQEEKKQLDLYTASVKSYVSYLSKRNCQKSMDSILIRLQDGLREHHAEVVLDLLFFHIREVNKPLYERLKTCKDETEMRAALGSKVLTWFEAGKKGVIICSDLLPESFFPILGAYLDHTDELQKETDAFMAGKRRA